MPWIAPLKPNAARALRTTAPLRFFAAESTKRSGVATYGVREGAGARVALRHATIDTFVFDELFVERIYVEPPPVAAVLARLGRPPRVADLGANVGMFAAWTTATHPGAELVCVEPDPGNVAVLRAAEQANGAGWEVWAAAAAPADASLEFVAGEYATSHAATAGDAGAITVPARDVLGLISRSDLVKIDIEGSEWALLADPRFAGTSAAAIALEFHPAGCPEPDAAGYARALLQAAGFETADVPTPSPPGYGSLWAWRA